MSCGLAARIDEKHIAASMDNSNTKTKCVIVNPIRFSALCFPFFKRGRVVKVLICADRLRLATGAILSSEVEWENKPQSPTLIEVLSKVI